jgi:hypothetical protein
LEALLSVRALRRERATREDTDPWHGRWLLRGGGKRHHEEAEGKHHDEPDGIESHGTLLLST